MIRRALTGGLMAAAVMMAIGGVQTGSAQRPIQRGDIKRPRPRDELLRVSRAIVDHATLAALITVDEQGAPQARTVEPFPVDSSWIIWIGTNPRSRKVQEIRRDPRVALYWYDQRAQGYVTLRGLARLVTDSASKERHWKNSWVAFYPDRKKDYMLIEVRPLRLEIVSQALGIVGDSLTWKPPTVEFPKR